MFGNDFTRQPTPEQEARPLRWRAETAEGEVIRLTDCSLPKEVEADGFGPTEYPTPPVVCGGNK